MKTKAIKKQQTESSEVKADFLFAKENYYIMAVGLVFIALGYLLMIGGGSDDPAVFNEDIFNTQRLTVAPILLVIGYIIEIFAIFYKKKDTSIKQTV